MLVYRQSFINKLYCLAKPCNAESPFNSLQIIITTNMKSKYIGLSVAFLLVSIASFCQTVNSAKVTQGPIITKGYYSIGNNSQKLGPGLQLLSDTAAMPVVTKGYYSIESNKTKSPKKLRWFFQQGPRPTVTKGYYSIGNNAQKH